MSAPTMTRSAYPVPVAELVPRAQKLAAELGTVPSRNRLKSEFRIGGPKAAELRELLLKQKAADDQSRAMHAHLVRRRSIAELPEHLRGESSEAAPDTSDSPAGPHLHAVPDPADQPGPETTEDAAKAAPLPQEVPAVGPGTPPASVRRQPVRSWPVWLLAAPAFVAIWSGWVGLGKLTGFGMVNPLPGIADDFEINTAITLPIGVETYAAFALHVWLSGRMPRPARRFAKWSAIGSLVLGALGQIAYHLMAAEGVKHAPWQITTVVACLPVAVLGMGAALAHLLHTDYNTD